MSSKRASVATFLAQAYGFQSGEHKLCVELGKVVMDPAQVIDYMKKFGDQISSQSFVKMYHKADSGSFDIKTKIFDTNKIASFNEVQKTYDLQNSVKLISNKIKPITQLSKNAEKVILVKRFTFAAKQRENWAINVELTKELNNPLEFKTKLTTCKELLVEKSLGEMSGDAYDYVSIVAEQVSSTPVTHADIVELVNDIQSEDLDSSVYQEAIHSLAKEIFFRDPVMVAQFKRQSGFKRLCNNTIELSRPIYFKQVLPSIDSFYITDKMDGTRAMLVVDEVYRRSGHRRIFLGTDIYAVSDAIYQIASFSKPSTSKTFESDVTILDVEMMNTKDGYKFYCFDVISIKSKRMSGYPFKERYAKFEEAKAILDKYDLGELKSFVKLTKEDYPKQIKQMYEAKRSYHIDGIIFTPEGADYKSAAKAKKHKFDRVFNTDYANTVSFKWKPLDQLTIDFYMMANPAKKGSYILCSGIDAKTFQLLKMDFFQGYKAPVSPNAFKYFPIQFNPSDSAFDYEWTPDSKESRSLDGMVGEFCFAENNKLLASPKLLRLREDRVQDIAKGEYYGNAMRYAELIWHSIRNPLTIESMSTPSDVGYFADNDNDWYHAQRGYNSFVKTYLMETYLYSPSEGKANLIDIAAGKGQDLARAVDMGFDEILLLDKDTDAIYELLERKYNLRVKRKGATANVHIKAIDLENSAEHSIQDLKLPEGRFQSCMINFAIHYIAHSAVPGQLDPLTEFAKFVAYNLATGGRIMITAFNGEEVFNMLQGQEEWSLRERGRVKYSIKRQFSSKELTSTDQSIGVMLPFSGSRYYDEYLVNFDHIQKVFEGNGFKLVKSDGFRSLERLYKKQNPRGYESMSAEDKAYVALYGYLIFEKN